MKMNLRIFVNKPKLVQQLEFAVDKHNVDKARDVLSKYFPSINIQLAHNKLIMEMADLIVSIAEEDVDYRDEYMSDIKKSTLQLISQYHKKKEAAERNLYRVMSKSNINYTMYTEEERDTLNYDDKTIQTILEQLDARDRYNNIMSGYEHEQYLLYNWLSNQITETLAGDTHETKTLTRSIIDE